MFQDISQFTKISDYLPIINGCLVADLVIILLVFNNIFHSIYLEKWYTEFQLNAVIADVLILVIGIILARFLYQYVFPKENFSIIKFTTLALIIQIIHDFLFYWFFQHVPPKYNYMLDFFKKYAQEVGIKAILGDSFMMIVACFASSYFASLSNNANVIIMVIALYLMPYFINFHTKL